MWMPERRLTHKQMELVKCMCAWVCVHSCVLCVCVCECHWQCVYFCGCGCVCVWVGGWEGWRVVCAFVCVFGGVGWGGVGGNVVCACGILAMRVCTDTQ